jgi:hypothetical protein
MLPIVILPESHLDHAIPPARVEAILARAAELMPGDATRSSAAAL